MLNISKNAAAAKIKPKSLLLLNNFNANEELVRSIFDICHNICIETKKIPVYQIKESDDKIQKIIANKYEKLKQLILLQYEHHLLCLELNKYYRIQKPKKLFQDIDTQYRQNFQNN